MNKKTRAGASRSFEELLERMKRERYGKVPAALELLARSDPEFTEKYDDLFQLLMTRDRTLTVKSKELMVIGILASKGEYDGLKEHIDRALTIGVSRRAIIEALELAMLYGGGAPSLVFGGLALIDSLKMRGG